MQEQRRRTVRHPFRLQRMDETQIIHMPRHVWKQFGNPMPRFAMPREIPQRLHHSLQTSPLASVGNYPRVIERHHFPIFFLQERFVIERIHMARPALHEDEDDPLRSRDEMRMLGGKCALRTGYRRFAGHYSQREVSKTTTNYP